MKKFRTKLHEDGVFEIELHDGKHNLVDDEFFVELKEIFMVVKQSSDIKTAVLYSGNPKCFSAGLNLKAVPVSFGTKDPARDALDFLKGSVPSWQDAITAAETCQKPVIALISGIAIGAAIDLITACDVRLAASGTVFSVREITVGLAADLGTLQRLPKIVGNDSWCREICLTGRDFDADEALKYGLVSKVLPNHGELLAEGLKIAKTIATKSPVAASGTKTLLVHSRDRSVQEGLDYNALWSSVMMNTPDLLEAAQSILQKSKPKFSKL